MKPSLTYLTLPLTVLLLTGCAETAESPQTEPVTVQENSSEQTTPVTDDTAVTKTAPTNKPTAKPPAATAEPNPKNPFAGYKPIDVDGGDLSGHREAKAVVNIGFGDRKYWAFTNEHAQLVKVVAKKIVLQHDGEQTTSAGRYYADEAKVPGVESPDLDEGHVIADSLGGVSNAYNITPQESTLNRHGDQAYMENAIRKAGNATDFEATITYPDTKTQIPSHYRYTYTLKGNKIVDDFDNVNPDQVNADLGLTKQEEASAKTPDTSKAASKTPEDVATVDTNGNGQVTIQEAKDAGFSMPITSDHWLYPYMRDNDHDGMVGE